MESVGGVGEVVALPFCTWQAAIKLAPVVLIAAVVTAVVPVPVLYPTAVWDSRLMVAAATLAFVVAGLAEEAN